MCGIFASVGFEPDPRHIDIVSHRGPDGRGWKVFDGAAGPVCLGHRRLSIIDLDERAGQPMVCSAKRFWLTFNGEIYNFVEIRKELAAKGVRFRTTSDSEVLLEAYAAWGEAMLEKLLGMFAFVIYDEREHRLFAARDRFGIKPLYYFSSADGIAFASEIKQLIELPGFSRRMNLPRVSDFLTAGYTDHTEETMFAQARQLRGGQFVILDLKQWKLGTKLLVRRYYDIPRRRGPPMSEADAASRFRDLLEDSIRLHLRSDVRVGSCLSGGLDSSSIVVLMDHLLGRFAAKEPIHTVSACFVEKEVDEKPFMDAIVSTTRTESHFIYPSAKEAFAAAELITWHQDEPYPSTSIYSQWCVFQEARRNEIKVMLDGQGADEQLAGYHHSSFSCHSKALVRKRNWGALARMIFERKRWHGLNISDQILSLPGRSRVPAWLRRAPPKLMEAPGEHWLDSSLLNGIRSERGAFGDVLSRDDVGEIKDIGDLCLADMKGASLPMLLRYEDRNSMAHSIEARVPFLDHRLVEFTLGLWDRHKIVGGDTKRVLRRAMVGLLPEKVRQRRDKLGFNTPEQSWLRGPLRPLVEAGVRQTLDLYPGLLNAREVIAFMHAALDGRRQVDATLWRIISLGIWGKVFHVSL
jgi:asparagine synthase (glutamine-hydrolysing)